MGMMMSLFNKENKFQQTLRIRHRKIPRKYLTLTYEYR